MKFVRVTDEFGNVIFVNLNNVKIIHREGIEERATVIEVANHKTYECYSYINKCPNLCECLIEI